LNCTHPLTTLTEVTFYMRNRAYLFLRAISVLCLILLTTGNLAAFAQSTATLHGTITDPQGATVVGAKVTVRNVATGIERTSQTDSAGNYSFPSMPIGTYHVEVTAEGFEASVVEAITLEVSQTVEQNIQMKVGARTEQVTVTSETPVVDSSNTTVGQVINDRTVQDIPLNGRHFVDLGLLVPGTLTPPQNGFLTAPLRGQGSFAIDTAGNREDTTNFMINGVNLNDMSQNQITFQPSISTVQEFKVDNQTFSAEYGRNSGSIVNIATRSGTNGWHGEGFEFFRNNDLDARNFFVPEIGEFRRNQFGGSLGGPIKKDKAFFFFSYEGTRQRQAVPTDSGVLSQSERAAVTDPAAKQLLPLLPLPNSLINGLPAFVGSASAPVDIDQWTLDIGYNLGSNDHVHGYYAFQRDMRDEPTLQGNSIPGFGDTRQSHRQILTLGETHTFGSNLVNDVRVGFSRIFITFAPIQTLNPENFGINVGVDQNLALPQTIIESIGLDFGGPQAFPQGRGDTTYVASDTLSYLRGNHAFNFGGEFRTFLNNNFESDAGLLVFSNVAEFQQGGVEEFLNTVGGVNSSLATKSVGLFATDSYKIKPGLTLSLGFRWDIDTPPSERYNRYVEFQPTTDELVRTSSPYSTNTHNFEPRVGFAWDPFHDGKTVIRGAYAILYQQPTANSVTGLTGNPPLALPVSAVSNASSIPLANPLGFASTAGTVSPSTINPNFKESYVQDWNLNVQRQITPTLGVMVGYFANKGTHLQISDNLNQFVDGARPYPTLSLNSPIDPGKPLTNIPNIDGVGNSSYQALWVTANKRVGHGLQFNASYTFSKSIDENSLSSQGVVVQNSNDLAGDRGLSDFNATQRFVINAIYDLPFTGNRAVEGWQVAAITQYQTGNPLNLVVGEGGGFSGEQTLRPDVIGNISNLGNPNQWFSNIVCNPAAGPCAPGAVFAIPVNSKGVFHFGDLGRNVIIGPGFSNTDFSIVKSTKILESNRIEFRADFFDIFNHPNFGNPGLSVLPGSTTFGVITSTRFQPGDSGSSRQIQFALKFKF
jgi:hypothetical protein